MTEHQRMILRLCKNPAPLCEVLGLDRIWIRGIEFPMGDDRIDMVFHDRFYDSVSPSNPATKVPLNWKCFVAELKTETGDHEMMGQLTKAVNHMQAFGTGIKHWSVTKGVAIAPGYTESGKKLLLDSGFDVLVWKEFESRIRLDRLK